jgi:hypothetical protein
MSGQPVVGRLCSITCYEAGRGNERHKKRDFPMPNLPPASDPRLVALVLAGLIAVLTLAATMGSPAVASTLPIAASQDERFQPPQQRALPPFGTRTALAPHSGKQQRPQGAEAAG